MTDSLDRNVSGEEMTYEAAMNRLEAIVGMLEDGSAPLEESLALYEEGVAMVRLCSKKLAEAEQKILLLRGDGDRPAEQEIPAASILSDGKGTDRT